jgi:hypothetical protein
LILNIESLLIRPIAYAVIVELRCAFKSIEAVTAIQGMLIVMSDCVSEAPTRGGSSFETLITPPAIEI